MSKRINLALPERSVKRLEDLRDLTDASSITEVIKNAVMTYEAVANHLKDGVVFTGQRPNGESFSVEFMIDVPQKERSLHVVGKTG